jgi:hypothetical protein
VHTLQRVAGSLTNVRHSVEASTVDYTYKIILRLYEYDDE